MDADSTSSSAAPDRQADPVEAVELGAPAAGGPAPQVVVYRVGSKPVVEVFTGGRWRIAVVRERLVLPDGAVAYTVTLDLGGGRPEQRTYRWPAGMRLRFDPASPGR